eukprot:1582874-Pleurochrysis_carterae.AAC.1
MAVGGLGRGISAVEALDRLVGAAEPNPPKRDYPCPWVHLFGDRKKGTRGCRHCKRAAEGSQERAYPADVIAQLKAKSTPELRTSSETPPLTAPSGKAGSTAVRHGAGAVAREVARGRSADAQDGARQGWTREPTAPPLPPEPPPARRRGRAGTR